MIEGVWIIEVALYFTWGHQVIFSVANMAATSRKCNQQFFQGRLCGGFSRCACFAPEIRVGQGTMIQRVIPGG